MAMCAVAFLENSVIGSIVSPHAMSSERNRLSSWFNATSGAEAEAEV